MDCNIKGKGGEEGGSFHMSPKRWESRMGWAERVLTRILGIFCGVWPGGGHRR
jgi:hypothetical protein